MQTSRACGKCQSIVPAWARSKHSENAKWLFQKDCVTVMKNKCESTMYSTIIIAVSTLTDAKFKDNIMNIVIEVSGWTQTMIRRLEDHKRGGVVLRAYDSFFFPCSFSAESCTINVLYSISKLPCKINQRELESMIIVCSFPATDSAGHTMKSFSCKASASPAGSLLKQSASQMMWTSWICRAVAWVLFVVFSWVLHGWVSSKSPPVACDRFLLWHLTCHTTFYGTWCIRIQLPVLPSRSGNTFEAYAITPLSYIFDFSFWDSRFLAVQLPVQFAVSFQLSDDSLIMLFLGSTMD